MTLFSKLMVPFAFLPALMGLNIAAQADDRPNILLLIADDLGYSDLGTFGGEIDTPNIDALAQEGLVMQSFYAAPSCSPTRAMLLTGNDQHLSGLGMMAEVRKRRFPEADTVRAGYEGYFRKEVVTVAELLRESGYQTILSGKWHLGLTPELQPQNQGFEESYTVLEGGSAQFKQKEMGLFPNYPATFLHNGEPMALPDDFNASVFYTDRLIEATEKARQQQKPFFAIAAYTAPHWPLQAPDEYLEKYRGHFDEGYQEVANQRLRRLKEMGLIGDEYPEVTQLESLPDWTAMTAEQRQRAAREMEIYAAMIDQMDTEIGRLLAHLKTAGVYDNTLVLFMSDNGPEPKDYDTRLSDWVAANFDNSLENLGKVDSFVTYGEHWAAVSAMPFRGHKQTVREGGLRVPFVAHFPGRIAAGSSERIASVRDLLPTLLDLTGVPSPGIEFAGRPIHPSLGRSLLPFLTGKEDPQSQHNAVFGWEVDGHAALRQGPMKLVYLAEGPEAGWRLFDVETDPAELNDLAGDQPETLQRLLAEWRHYAQLNNIALNADMTPALPVDSRLAM